MLGRGAGDLARHTPQPFLNELLQAPTGAVAGEHRQIMDMEVRVAVGAADLLVINLAEPVIGCDGAGVGQDQSAHGVGDGGVFLYPPVGHPQIIVHQLFVVQNGGAHVPQLFPVLAVENVGLGHFRVAGTLKNGLHAVLNGLHIDPAIPDLIGIIRRDLQGKQVDHIRGIGNMGGVKGFHNGTGDTVETEFGNMAVPLDDLIHGPLLLFSIVHGSVCWEYQAKRCPAALRSLLLSGASCRCPPVRRSPQRVEGNSASHP